MGPDCLWCSSLAFTPWVSQATLKSGGTQVTEEPPLSACALPGGLSTTFSCICPSLHPSLDVYPNGFWLGTPVPTGLWKVHALSGISWGLQCLNHSPSQQNPSLRVEGWWRRSEQPARGTCRPPPAHLVLSLHWFSQLLCFLASPAPWRPKAAALLRRSHQGSENQLQQRCPVSALYLFQMSHMVFWRLCCHTFIL